MAGVSFIGSDRILSYPKFSCDTKKRKEPRYSLGTKYTTETRGSNTSKICSMLDKFFKDPEKSDQWLRTKNPLLGMRPWDLILMGKSERLMKFIKNQLAENFKKDLQRQVEKGK